MKVYTKVLTFAATAALFAAPTFAQGTYVKVDVPFPFHVAEKAMPAGTYEVKYSASTFLLLIKGEEGISAAMTIGSPGPAINGPENAVIKFRVYGKTRFFAGLWTPGAGDLAVAPCHMERELAKAEQGTETALVIVPRR